MTKIDTSTEAVKALLKDVTPGPWRPMQASFEKWGNSYSRSSMPVDFGYIKAIYPFYIEKFTDPSECQIKGWANTKFIAAARELVPALLAERDEYKLRAELDAAYAIIAAERGEVVKLRAALSKKDQAND